MDSWPRPHAVEALETEAPSKPAPRDTQMEVNIIIPKHGENGLTVELVKVKRAVA